MTKKGRDFWLTRFHVGRISRPRNSEDVQARIGAMNWCDLIKIRSPPNSQVSLDLLDQNAHGAEEYIRGTKKRRFGFVNSELCCSMPTFQDEHLNFVYSVVRDRCVLCAYKLNERYDIVLWVCNNRIVGTRSIKELIEEVHVPGIYGLWYIVERD
jgi:hypothetical protein